MTDRASIDLRRVRAIRIHCPITAATFAALTQGHLETIEQDPVAAPILAFIRADDELGDFGLYKGVFEVSLGFEGFTPTQEATPSLGEGGGNTLSPTAVIKTYIRAGTDAETLRTLLAEIAARHPWQIPVIEIAEVQLLALA